MTPDDRSQSPMKPTQDDLHAAASSRKRNPYRRLKLLLAGLLSALIAGLAFYFSRPTQYSACALILLEKNAPFIAFQADSDERRSDRFVETQIELIRSPAILNRVVGDRKAAACAELKESVDPVAHIHDRLVISQVRDSNLYEIRYASASAEDAVNIVNAVVSEYFDAQPSSAAHRMMTMIGVLAKEQERREANLTRLREKALQLSRETHGPNPFNRSTKSRNEDRYDLTSDLRRKASDVDLELALLDAELRRLESSPSKLPHDNAVVELAVQNHPAVIESQRTVNELQSQVDLLQESTSEGASDENDAAAELKRELDERLAALNQIKKDQRDHLQGKHSELHAQERFQTRESLRDKIAALNVKQGVLATHLDAAEMQLEADEEKLIELDFTLAELDREKRVYELIAARKLALTTERNAPARVELVLQARSSQTPDARIALWKLGLVCGIAFLLPFVIAGVWPARVA